MELEAQLPPNSYQPCPKRLRNAPVSRNPTKRLVNPSPPIQAPILSHRSQEIIPLLPGLPQEEALMTPNQATPSCPAPKRKCSGQIRLCLWSTHIHFSRVCKTLKDLPVAENTHPCAAVQRQLHRPGTRD